MAIMAAFPLSLVVIISSIFFFIDIDILDFFSNCYYIFFTLPSKGTSNMPRTESSSAVSQEYLGFYYLSSAILFLGSSLGPQCKNGPGPQIIGPYSKVNHEHYKSKANPNIFFLKSSRGLSSSYIIFFFSTLLKKIYFMVFHVFFKN